MKKRKIVYQERYKPGSLKMLKEFLPSVPSATGHEVIECEVRSAGSYDDGTEFQVLHVVLKAKAL